METAGAAGTFPYSFAYQNQDVIIYSYGIFDKSAKATAKFGNYYVTSGTQVADLIAERKIDESDYLITKTKGIVVAGETDIDITSCTCNTVAVPASGSVTVPYDSSVSIEVSANDVDGKYLSILVDGVRGNIAYFGVQGYAYVGAPDLAGGEQIQIQIGSLVGQTFVPEFTYGGIAVVGAQASAFTSVSANGVSIAVGGNTQVAEAASIPFTVAATGVTNKYLRLSVNGTARTPVAFSNGAASDTISGLSDGDVVTFAIGHMSGSTFIQDVAYGGSAVIAEVPASFVSVSCNGTTIAASGTTNVNAAAENVYNLTTANAIGKTLAIMDGSNTVVDVMQISQNSIEFTDNSAAGDQTKFAIGTGLSPETFQAQTTFGGTVNFVEAPHDGIQRVRLDGVNMTGNVEGAGASHHYTSIGADITGDAFSSAYFAIVESETKPTVGTPIAYLKRAQNDPFEGYGITDVTVEGNKKYWFVAGSSNGSNITPGDVWPYYVLYTNS